MRKSELIDFVENKRKKLKADVEAEQNEKVLEPMRLVLSKVASNMFGEVVLKAKELQGILADLRDSNEFTYEFRISNRVHNLQQILEWESQATETLLGGVLNYWLSVNSVLPRSLDAYYIEQLEVFKESYLKYCDHIKRINQASTEAKNVINHVRSAKKAYEYLKEQGLDFTEFSSSSASSESLPAIQNASISFLNGGR